MITGFPAKRSIGTLVSAATIIQSASSISFAVSTFFAPPEPLVSTLIKQPNSAAFFSRLSAAFLSVSFCSSFSSFSDSASSMTFKNSSTEAACFNPLVKFSSIRRTDRRLNTSRCTLSSVSGAAIKKIK